MTRPAPAKDAPGTPPPKRSQLAWLAGGLAVVLAGIAFAAALGLRHPGGDPGGVRQKALRSISVGLPSDARVQHHSAGGPIRDSCDGRPGTEGWSPVSNDYQFTSTRSAEAVIATAQARLKGAGWTQTAAITSPAPLVMWTKTVSEGVVAHAQLSVGSPGPKGPSYWDLGATAPPDGTPASGC